MKEILEVFKEFDINNIGNLLIISILLISVVAGYIQLFHASEIETVLMSKSDELKRFSFLYFIMFIIFGTMNYLFTINVSLVVANVVIFLLMLLTSSIAGVLNHMGRAKAFYIWCEERKNIIIILTGTSIITYIISVVFKANLISCVILGALVEVLIVAITVFNNGHVMSTFCLYLEDEKWYVYKRIGDEYLLCGNESIINNSTKRRLVSIAYILKENICFEKEC